MSPLISGALRVLGALALTYVFMILLLTAVAQQSVLSRMDREKLEVGYGVAYGMVRDFEKRRDAIRSLLKSESGLITQSNTLDGDLRLRLEEYDTAWDKFASLVRTLARTGVCDIQAAKAAPDSAQERITLWNDVQQCVIEDRIPPLNARQFKELAQGPFNLPETYRKWASAYDRYEKAKSSLESNQKRIEAESKQSADEQKAVRSFGEIEVLRGRWFLGGGQLVPFPPPLLQILFALVSGMFGALLVTLVLIVYPKNTFTLTSTSAYGARILLGGLIAVCVYIILLSGTAVLGASSELRGAGTNYMTFCAVAVLAGMFSDRVAHWLSERANVLFKVS